MTARERRIPGPDHPITVEKTGQRVIARVGGRVIADSVQALTLQEGNSPAVQYIPIDDVDQAVLAPSTAQTYCPYKGDASYYSITLPEGDLADVVWSYREPYESVAAIADHVAFYTDRVDVVVGD
ncbi:DUF427 domain-containing protein [Nocardia sp. NBC_01327]|uniref:DUF427 domain-containing protein n=1 Tax=Nocardia sp. NBC_01327 TaxID=2903593 RepID=UPI002E168281|nr:DUF427 domain-containing protein [Nocardia sp. NBC_01327]